MKFRGPERFGQRGADGVELVVARHLLDDGSAVVLEHYEVSYERQKAFGSAYALEKGPKLRLPWRGELLP